MLMPAAEARPAVLELMEACNRFEAIALPISPELLSPNAIELAAFDGETLVGYAAIVSWGSGPEMSGCLLPEHRRRGAATLLLEAAQQACRERGDTQMLLVCDERSPSGRGFAQARGAQFAFAEHRLQLDPTRIDPRRPRRPELVLRPAATADLDTLARILAAAFGDPEAKVCEHVTCGLQMPDRQYFLGELQGEPVGVLRVGRYAQGADITSFGVLPAHQGRGYGRQMLADSVAMLVAEGWREVMIEVNTANANALGLYQTCGFVIQASYGYYALDL